MEKFSLPQNIFFNTTVLNNALSSNSLIQEIDRGLEKSVLSDTLFEMFFAIRRFAIPDSEISFQAAKEGNMFYLLAKFFIQKKDLLSLDVEIDKANSLKGQSKRDIYAQSVKDMKKTHSLDGFNMVMAYAQSDILYNTQDDDNGRVAVEVFMKIPENKYA